MDLLCMYGSSNIHEITGIQSCDILCSFAEYYNPQNTEFGVLRVLNDDLVKVSS
jgi:hypothetical protein